MVAHVLFYLTLERYKINSKDKEIDLLMLPPRSEFHDKLSTGMLDNEK